MVQPPARGTAHLPESRALLVEHINRNNRTTAGQARNKGRVIAQSQIVTKPDENRTF
jgi:hypothetical protein